MALGPTALGAGCGGYCFKCCYWSGCCCCGLCCSSRLLYILGAVVLSYTVAVAVFASTGKMLLPVKSVVFSHLSEPFS